MNINNTTRPYIPPPGKQSRIDALKELRRIESIPDLADQDRESRVPIMIRGLSTYWSQGLCAETPHFVQHAIGLTKRIHLIDTASSTVGVYDRTGKDSWERRAILEKPEEIGASLPRKALNGGAIGEPASANQIATVRRLLDLPPDRPMPPLSAITASRILDRIVSEKAVIELGLDFQRWLNATRTVAA